MQRVDQPWNHSRAEWPEPVDVGRRKMKRLPNEEVLRLIRKAKEWSKTNKKKDS